MLGGVLLSPLNWSWKATKHQGYTNIGPLLMEKLADDEYLERIWPTMLFLINTKLGNWPLACVIATAIALFDLLPELGKPLEVRRE